jgi:hypothetical protein
VKLRLAYDGISRRVLEFADWFDPAAWPQVAEAVTARLREAGVVPPAADGLRSLPYEPVFSAEGPVMRFDLRPSDATGAVPLPLEQVAPWIAPERRVLLDAAAAGP